MKKILMVMMILTTFLFVSCKSSIEETYTVDGGFITEHTCSELTSKPEWLCPSYQTLHY